MATAKTSKWTKAQTPVGLRDIAELTGYSIQTVRSMSYKKQLPQAEGSVSGNPVWQRGTIEAWHKARIAEQEAKAKATAERKAEAEASKKKAPAKKAPAKSSSKGKAEASK